MRGTRWRSVPMPPDDRLVADLIAWLWELDRQKRLTDFGRLLLKALLEAP